MGSAKNNNKPSHLPGGVTWAGLRLYWLIRPLFRTVRPPFETLGILTRLLADRINGSRTTFTTVRLAELYPIKQPSRFYEH
jgi:hypothetical protein